MKRSEFIIAAAQYYIGKKEKPNNAGFEDPAFEKELASVGWYQGAPWCAFFVKLIFLKAYKDNNRLQDAIRRMSNGGCIFTLINHRTYKTFETGSVPKPGAQVIWRHGKGLTGHTGIVVSVKGNTMKVIEGNTNASGSREGNMVAEKIRTVTRDFKAKGLNIEGYIYPVEL